MNEQTLILVKPDGVERKLTGEIVCRFENSGLKIVALKMLRSNRTLAEKHYPKTKGQLVGMGNKTLKATLEKYGNLEKVKKIFRTENPYEIGKTLRKWMINFLISGPVVAFVLEGEKAIKKSREISGYTDPIKAKKGTIRGDFENDSIARANKERRAVKNLVHASGSLEEAKRETKLWFKKNEFFD